MVTQSWKGLSRNSRNIMVQVHLAHVLNCLEMLTNLLVVLCVAAVAAKPTWKDLGNYTFQQYLKDFNLKFEASEIKERETLFHAELARVQAHNAKNLSWKEGINKFSAMPKAEKKAFFGRNKGAAQQKKMLTAAKSLPENFELKPVSALPANVDWRQKG